MNPNTKRWSNFDIVWFTSQLILLLIINIIILSTSTNWLLNTTSLMASIFGAVGTWLAVKKYNMNYLFGIIHVILYGIISFYSKVYGDFVLNILIFLPMDIYGWIVWSKVNQKPQCDCPNIEVCDCIEQKSITKSLNTNQWIISITTLILSTLVFALLLDWLGDPAATLDSASTTISIFGMYLMVKYYREQWWVWLVVNLVSVGIWTQVLLNGDMYALVFIAMWSIYTFNSIIGIRRWIK